MKTEDIFEGGQLLPLVEDFYTIQGEGFHTGKPAYFIRLGGCDVGCKWCDAKFTWNAATFPPKPIDLIIERAKECQAKAIVVTGGEPTLYPLELLTSRLKDEGFETFIETSGTNEIEGSFDWICLSPKRQQPPLLSSFLRADELKVIIQSDEDIVWAVECARKVRYGCSLYLQPEWSKRNEVTAMIVDFVKKNPRWNISVQMHKFINIP